jgi:putative transposase
MLERKGMIVNDKKLYRICREEGLYARRRSNGIRAWPMMQSISG